VADIQEKAVENLSKYEGTVAAWKSNLDYCLA